MVRRRSPEALQNDELNEPMVDNIAWVRERLHTGEDGQTEFKEVRFGKRGVTDPNAESFAAELVAFSNANGGVVLIGVTDSGDLQGLPADSVSKTEEWVVNVARQNCVPAVQPHIVTVRLDGRGDRKQPVVMVEVPRSIFVHHTSGGRYYTRVGSTKRLLETVELARLIRERESGSRFDDQLVFAASVTALDQVRLESFFGRAPTIPWSDILRNTKVTGRGRDGEDRPTVAGLLSFGKEATEFLPSAVIEAACYGGVRLSSDDLVHVERIDGPVSDQIDAAVAFVSRFTKNGKNRPAGWPRGPEPLYDLEVVEEAVVNAVAHRDYSLHGSKIRLFLFADRLELYSPGKPPHEMTIIEMRYALSTRNERLVSFLSRIHSRRTGEVFLESRGEGVRKILERGEAHSGRSPEYDLFGQQLRLTVWSRPDRDT